MEPAWQRRDATLYQGDALSVLRAIPSESIHACITSPPYYGLRQYDTEPQVWGGDGTCQAGAHDWQERIAPARHSDTGANKGAGLEGSTAAQEAQRTVGRHATCMRCGAWRGELGGEPTPEMFVDHLVAIFQEVRRVLRADGTCWLNLGDSYWGSWGNAGNRPDLDGRPAVQRQRTSEFVPRHGVENLRERGPASFGHLYLKPKDMIGIPWMTAFALRADGWYLRSDIIWEKKCAMPESVQDRATKSHEYVFMLAKSERYFYDASAIAERSVSERPSGNGYKRVERLSFADPDGTRGSDERWQPQETRRMRTVWSIASTPFSARKLGGDNAEHYAVMAPEVARRAIAAGTSEYGVCGTCSAPYQRVVEQWEGREQPPSLEEPSSWRGSSFTSGKTGVAATDRVGKGQRHARGATIGWRPTCTCPDADIQPATVLDPFSGAGTSGVVALTLGRRYVGVELNPRYVALSARRLEPIVRQGTVFDALAADGD